MAAPQRKYTHVTDARLDADALRCRRAIPRDLLTGAPLSPDAVVRRIRVDDYPSPRQDTHTVRYGASQRPYRRNAVASELPIIAYVDADEPEDDTAEGEGDAE